MLWIFGQNSFNNLTVLKMSMGVMLCLILISCGISLEDSYQFHNENGTAPRNVENPQQQVNLLLNQMAQFPTGQILKIFYDQKQANIQIIQKPTQQSNVPLETTLSLASLISMPFADGEISEAMDLISNSYQLSIEQSEDGYLKCSILINDRLEKNTQIHLLAHQLERCRIEMDIYSEITTHKDIHSSYIAQFFALKDQITNGEVIEANEPLMPLVTNLEVYSKFNALLINQKLKAENLSLNVDLENNRVLAEAVLSDLNERDSEMIQGSPEHILSIARGQTIKEIIDNFLASSNPNSSSSIALLESSSEYSSNVYRRPITLQPFRTRNINRPSSFNKKASDPDTHTDADSNLEVKPTPDSDPNTHTSKPEVKPTPTPDSNTDTDSKPDLESTPDPDPDTHTDAYSNPDLESTPDPDPDTHTDTHASKPEVKPTPDSDPNTHASKPEVKPTPTPDSNTDTDSKPDLESTPDPDPNPDTHADSNPDVKSTSNVTSWEWGKPLCCLWASTQKYCREPCD